MYNKDIRRAINEEAKLHLESLKYSHHISDVSLLDEKIARDIVNNNIPEPSDDFKEQAADILGGNNLEAND